MPYKIKGNTVVKKDSGKVVGHSKNPKKYLRVLNAVENGWTPPVANKGTANLGAIGHGNGVGTKHPPHGRKEGLVQSKVKIIKGMKKMK